MGELSMFVVSGLWSLPCYKRNQQFWLWCYDTIELIPKLQIITKLIFISSTIPKLPLKFTLADIIIISKYRNEVLLQNLLFVYSWLMEFSNHVNWTKTSVQKSEFPHCHCKLMISLTLFFFSFQVVLTEADLSSSSAEHSADDSDSSW